MTDSQAHPTGGSATASTGAGQQAAAYSALGTPRDRVTLPVDVFDGTINTPVMHQAVKAFLANQRQGNASTKIRKYVIGGNQKPWKQKGTGRARQGSTRAPQWVGGGTVFGPIPRSYAQYVPRQVRALARQSALNTRARDGAVLVIDAFAYDRPETRRVHALLGRLALVGKKVLILTDGVKRNVYLSARNIPSVEVMPYSDVSTYHILWSDAVLIESSALGQPMDPLAETAPAPSERRAARVAATPPRPMQPAGAKPKGAKPKGAAGHAAAPVRKPATRAAGTHATKPTAAHAPKAAAKGTATKGTAAKGGAKKSAAKKAAPKKKKGK